MNTKTPGERFDRATGSSPLRTERAYYDPRTIIIEPGWNGRIMTSPEALAHIATLEASILKDGVREPIKVRYDKKAGTKTLVTGQCRLTACLNLVAKGHKLMIPCERVDGDQVELTIENLTSNAGLPLTQWEAGVEYRKLLRWGQNIDDIAQRVCKPKRYITEAIELSAAPLEGKEMLAAGEITPGALLHAVKEHGKEEGVKKLKEAVASRPKAPEPAQKTLPGAPAPKAKKPKPLARPKKTSAKEQVVKTVGACLNLADDLAKHVIADDLTFEVMEDKAKAYLKARGL
jgi:ParB-like chromosome segregation protein Spo0J